MPSNQTPNYALSQWSKGDRVLMDDFNADNAKIDAAIKAEADVREAETSALAGKLRNCKIVLCTRTGTGDCGSDTKACQIDFNGQTPLMVLLMGNKSQIAVGMPGCYGVHFSSSFIMRWSDTGLSWYSYSSNPADQFNSSGQTYYYFMIYADE